MFLTRLVLRRNSASNIDEEMELAPASAWQKQPERETVVWQHNSLAEALMNSRPGNKTASHSEDLAPHEAKKDKKVCDYPIIIRSGIGTAIYIAP